MYKMKYLAFILIIKYINSLGPIGGVDETPEGWTSKYNGTVPYKPNVYEVLGENETACDKLNIKGAEKPEDCNKYTLEDPDYRCCFIKFSVGNYTNNFCLRVAYTEDSIKDVKKSFDGASSFQILCNTNYVYFNITFIILLFVSILI